MTDQSQQHDQRTTRCRRLGHEVCFGYCRQENSGQPCRLILDCWWQSFDVQSFLREQLTPEAFAALQQAAPPNKVLTLVGLIEQAKARLAEEGGDQAPQRKAKPDSDPSDRRRP